MVTVIEIDGLKSYYVVGSVKAVKEIQAVDDVTLKIRKDEIFGIAGESGCGKTTLIKTITGLIAAPLTIRGGQVTYNFESGPINILDIDSDVNRRVVRGAKLSYVPQGSMSVLNPVRRIQRSFEDFITAHLDKTRAECKEMASAHLAHLGLSPSILRAYPHQLSGGMQQRVTIALATILRPEVVLADEPSTALDVVMQRSVIQLLKQIKREQQNTFVMITHDLAIHANFCDRIAIMYAGQIVEVAPVRTIFKESLHPYTQFLIAALPRVGDKSERVSAPGAPPSLLDPPAGCRFHPRCPKAMDVCKLKRPKLTSVAEDHEVACFLVSEESYDD